MTGQPILIEDDPLGCEPGTIISFDRQIYECPFCGALCGPLQFEGIALDTYAVDGRGFIVRCFQPQNDIRLPCACGNGFWIGGIIPFPFSSIRTTYEALIQADCLGLPSN